MTDWIVLGQEQAGAEAKKWITPAEHAVTASREQWWLYKPVKFGTLTASDGTTARYRRHDDMAERVACALAGLLGLPAADVDLARDSDSEGIISRNVTPDGWDMQGGDVMLSEIPGYQSSVGDGRPKHRVGHNLANIRSVLDGRLGPLGRCQDWPAFDVFAGFLVFDAWIANTDRHAMNWAVLDHDDERRLAASFDHGSALGSGSPDAHLIEPIKFARRGMATRFESGRRLALVDLALESIRLAGERAPMWLSALDAVPSEQVADTLRAVPGLSEVRRMFVEKVLGENKRRLLA